MSPCSSGFSKSLTFHRSLKCALWPPITSTRYANLLPHVSQQNYLAHEELLIAVEMLSAVVLLNRALDSNDLVSVQNQLRSPAIGLNNLDESYVER